MAERTLVRVDDVDLFKQPEGAREQYAAILSDIPDYCCVLFVYDTVEFKINGTMKKLAAAVKEHAQILSFGKQSERDLCSWITRHFRAHGKSVTDELCQYLIFRTDGLMTTLGGEIGVPVFRGDGQHPVEIAQGAIREAVDHMRDVVIVDTAGRLQIDEQMMQEAVDIKRAVKPDQVLMVVDAMTGQDIVNVVSTFAERTDFDGVIISKLDGDARGGGALSVRAVTGKPIKFVSMGEKPDSLEVFSPDRMAKRILGMGDVVGIIEKAQEVADAQKLEDAERMLRDGLTMNDLLDQMRMLKKMGGMKSLIGMLPGGQRMLNQMGGNMDESMLDKIEAMIQSMTAKERLKPSIINGQRRARIARGSGTTPTDVNNLMKQWGEMNKMMGKMRSMAQQQAAAGKRGKKGKKGKKMRMPGIPGMGGANPFGGMGGNPFAGMGGGSGNADMDMLRAMEQQMKGKKF
uniref:signal recognition particle protein n=1 Tax=uncultured Enorma sp. TaxID=1714346 RepID=UPI0025E3F1ED|nr:signal recognition particle protein [uncultured Enorma sp.]